MRVFLAATATVTVAALWQWFVVERKHAGDWSALFHTGASTALPPGVDAYRFAGDPGYDGQYYHLIAHDPLLLAGTQKYVDNPRLRWRRILVPGLAFLLALGNAQYVDTAYVCVVLGFVFLGSYWLGRTTYAPAFLLVPAVLVSLDRMTVDVALAALCVAFALYPDSWKIYPVLAAAPLARETGVVLALAYAIAKRKPQVLVALAPAAAWAAYVAAHTAPDHTPWISPLPFAGLITRTLHPWPYRTDTSWLLKA